MTMLRLFLINFLIRGLAGDGTNFLFIVVDDLRPALGCYGDDNAHTPNIDRLAESSVLFTKAYAQLALCAPSRNSFLTGRRPDTLQLYDFYSYWRDVAGNFTTLPEHLKNHNYTTKSVGKIFHPGISSNGSDDSPYSWTEKPFHPFTNRYKNSPVCGDEKNSSLFANLICPVDVNAMPGATLPDFETLNVAKKFIKNQRNDEKPFFLAVGFQKPHIPLKYPREYLKHHPLNKFKIPEPYRWPENVSSVAYNPWSDLRKRHDVKNLHLNFPWEKIPANFGVKIIQSYYAAVTYIDELIGILLDQLRVSEFRENTVVVLTSDHGWSLGEHAEWAKYSNFEVALRVPLIIYIPSKKSQVEVTNVGISGFLHPIEENSESRDEKTTTRTNSSSKISRIPKNIKRINEKSIDKNDYAASDNICNICIDETVELVDIFPTIAELAGHPTPICPDNELVIEENQRRTSFLSPDTCSEGMSLMPLVRASPEDKSVPWKKGSFSQYPRPALQPRSNSDEPRLRDITTMGYSLRTQKYRYTVWLKFFSTVRSPNWNSIVAEELYDHDVDPHENVNVADYPKNSRVKEKLRTLLRAGWRKSLPNYEDPKI